jgi:hypothetical protein
MMKRILRKRLFKPTLIAFATALFIVFPTTASAMPMSDDGSAVTPRPFVVPSTKLTDGWYSAAIQQTPLTDGWYTAVVKPTASSTSTGVTPTSTSDFPYRNIGIAFAFGLLLAALLATAVVKTRRDRLIPVLQ